MIFDQYIGISYNCTSDLDSYLNSKAVKVNYGQKRICADEILVPDSGFLFEKSIHPQKPSITHSNDLIALFPIAVSTADFTFDLFSMIFFLISRYEEYQEFTPDQHGRFTADQSLAAQHGFLQLPIVDLWVQRFIDLAKNRYPQIKIPPGKYRFQPTYDIDLAWAYRHKGFLRTILSGIRHFLKGDFQSLTKQVSVSLGKSHDPFFTFKDLDRLHKRFQLKPLYFFLLGNYATYDKNVSHKSIALQELIKQINQQYKVGIHPSYASNVRTNLLGVEIGRLKKITGEKIWRSRQHFLKLRFPSTYRQLLHSQIRSDYSLGYASDIGFRASTSKAFYWYDLEKEEKTELLLHPFQVMDVTLKQYLQLKPDAAVETVSTLIDSIKKTNGVFTTLWHNSSFSYIDGWQDWWAVYEAIIKLSKP
jgi:hypothetical protein